MPEDLKDAEEEFQRRLEDFRFQRRLEDFRRRSDAHRRRADTFWRNTENVWHGSSSIFERAQGQLDSVAAHLDSLSVPSVRPIRRAPVTSSAAPPPAPAPATPAGPPKSLWERLEEAESETAPTHAEAPATVPSVAVAPHRGGRAPSDWWILLVVAVLWVTIIGTWWYLFR